MQAITTVNNKELSNTDITRLFIQVLDASAKTKETYTRSLRAWNNYLDHFGITFLEATRETVLEYKNQLTQTKSAATVNAYLTSVRKFYSWLEAVRVCPNIAADIKGLKKSSTSKKEALTLEQAKKLLNKKPETLSEKRDYAIINLMLRCGLRTIEVTRANFGDLSQVSGEAVLYVQGKGYADKGEFVVLNEASLSPILAYLQARSESGEKLTEEAPLFASIGNRNQGGRMTTRSVSRIAAQAFEQEQIKTSHLTAHSLRHTAVTFALKGGASVQEVQAMARHKSINTTMIYAHNLDRINAAAENSIDRYLAS